MILLHQESELSRALLVSLPESWVAVDEYNAYTTAGSINI